MKKISLMFVGILLGVVLLGEANARQTSGQPEITTGKLVNALRLLNTHEYSYKNENGRFADRDQMLSYLRQKELLSRSQIDLENPKPYELAITISSDGMHYQIALQPWGRPSTARRHLASTSNDLICGVETRGGLAAAYLLPHRNARPIQHSSVNRPSQVDYSECAINSEAMPPRSNPSQACRFCLRTRCPVTRKLNPLRNSPIVPGSGVAVA